MRLRWSLWACLLLAGCRSQPPPAPLVIAYPQGPGDLLPHRNNDEYTSSVLGNVYEPLVALDRDLALTPTLAESWHTPDDQTWVFQLRPGLRLHDGRSLVAEQVRASLELARSDPLSRRQAELAAVTAIEAPDPATLVIRTRGAFAALPNRLAGVPVGVASQTAGGRPVGTGPYRIREWTPSGDTVLEAFEGYRAGTPPIRELTFRVVPDTQRQLDLLARGEVHVVSDVPSALAAALGGRSGVRLVSRKGLLVTFLALDCARERTPYVSAGRNPFRDVRVRRALALAIDRQALVTTALAGQGEVADQIVGPQVFGHRRDLPGRPCLPHVARQLLAEAGFAEGFAMDLDVLDSDISEGVTGRIVADLGRVGIRVRPRPADLASLAARVESRDTSAYLMPWISTSGDAGSSYEYLLRTPGGGYGIDNGGGYSNVQLDRLLDDASRLLKTAERRAMLMSVAKIVYEEVPVVPLFRRVDVYAVAKDLDFRPRLDREIHGAELRWLP